MFLLFCLALIILSFVLFALKLNAYSTYSDMFYESLSRKRKNLSGTELGKEIEDQLLFLDRCNPAKDFHKNVLNPFKWTFKQYFPELDE